MFTTFMEAMGTRTSKGLFLIASLLWSISSAVGAPPRRLDITYSIPNGYTGLLIMAFNMPGGAIYDREFDIVVPPTFPEAITVEFDEDGIARVGHPNLLSGTGKRLVIERETGAELPIAQRTRDLGKPLSKRAVLWNGGSGYTRKGRKEFLVELFLVGDAARFPEHLINYKVEEIDGLLFKHFGLPLPKSGELEDFRAFGREGAKK